MRLFLRSKVMTCDPNKLIFLWWEWVLQGCAPRSNYLQQAKLGLGSRQCSCSGNSVRLVW